MYAELFVRQAALLVGRVGRRESRDRQAATASREWLLSCSWAEMGARICLVSIAVDRTLLA